MKKYLAGLAILGLVALGSTAQANIMTFDGGYVGSLNQGETYSQNGMTVTIESLISGRAEIGDPLGPVNPNPTNGLYFHGSNAFVQFALTNGGLFNLDGFDALTNGLNFRKLTTSTGVEIPFGYYGGAWVNVSLQNDPRFQNLQWIRISTPWFSTQIDNLAFQPAGSPVPIPGAVFLLSPGLLVLAAARKRFVK